LTPSEFNSLSEVYNRKQETEVDLVKASAYWAESLARTKRLPNFEQWMNPPKPARPLSDEEAAIRFNEHEDMIARSKAARARGKMTEEGQPSDG
jgi:hypothetical protein